MMILITVPAMTVSIVADLVLTSLPAGPALNHCLPSILFMSPCARARHTESRRGLSMCRSVAHVARPDDSAGLGGIPQRSRARSPERTPRTGDWGLACGGIA